MLLCVAIGLCVRMAIILRPVDVLADRYLADDFFYYLNVAFNVAGGRGSTFDGGITHTNGYNPLLMALLALVFGVGATKAAAIRVGLVIEAVAFALATWLASRCCVRRQAFIAAVLVAGLMSFNPFFVWPSVNGFETGLAAATAFVALELWDREAPAMAIGAACGVAFLARTDALALAASLLVVRSWEKRWRSAVGIAVGFVVTVMPFVLWSAYRFGVALPESALQKSHLRSMASIAHSAGIVISTIPGIVVTHRTLERVPIGVVWLLGIGTASVCTLGARQLGPARILFLFSLMGGYSAFADGFEGGALRRYLFVVWILTAMSFALAIERADGLIARAVTIGRGLAPSALLTAPILFVQWVDCARLVRWDRATKPASSYVGSCRRLGAALDGILSRDDRAGSFDSGSLGYFSSRPVVNLDGLVNDDISKLQKQCIGEPYGACLLRYLHEKRITVLIAGTGFGWTRIFPDWTDWIRVYTSPPLADGAQLVVLRVPD